MSEVAGENIGDRVELDPVVREEIAVEARIDGDILHEACALLDDQISKAYNQGLNDGATKSPINQGAIDVGLRAAYLRGYARGSRERAIHDILSKYRIPQKNTGDRSEEQREVPPKTESQAGQEDSPKQEGNMTQKSTKTGTILKAVASLTAMGLVGWLAYQLGYKQGVSYKNNLPN